MPKIKSGVSQWNKVIYKDCMNEENGLPTLEDESVDFGIADPPWNINYKGAVGSTGRKTPSKAHYKDNYQNKWNLLWFNQLDRICKRIVIAPGRQNLQWWYKNTNPLDIFIHYKKNGAYGSNVATFNNYDVYLYFGDKVSKPYWTSNVFEVVANTGWVKDKLNSSRIFIHTSPKSFEVFFRIIKGIDPKSVIDPFMGSGTTAEVCTKLGIPYLGYEINKIYKQDIDKRLKGCKKEPKQVEIDMFNK